MIGFRKIISAIAVLAGLSCSAAQAADEDEISLFDASGKATAYIAPSDDMTIYLWSGKPVAYLQSEDGSFSIYGFNGEHLGWFVKGVIWGHDGNGVCADKSAISRTGFEPFKAFKQFQPFRSFTKIAPARPTFTGRFGEITCGLLLASGGK